GHHALPRFETVTTASLCGPTNGGTVWAARFRETGPLTLGRAATGVVFAALRGIIGSTITAASAIHHTACRVAAFTRGPARRSAAHTPAARIAAAHRLLSTAPSIAVIAFIRSSSLPESVRRRLLVVV